jgi:hypothetical protein
MKRILALAILGATMAFASNLAASPPTLPKRNIDFAIKVAGEPKKVGDLFQVTWSFTLHKEEDSVLRAFFAIDDSAAAKAFLYVYPRQQFVSGDSVWWGRPQYDVTYNFSATYRVVTLESMSIGPIVEYHRVMMSEGALISRNSASGIKIPFPVVKQVSDTLIDVVGKDTVKVVRDFPILKLL